MDPISRSVTAVALAFALAALTGSALAAPPSNPPGNSGNAPGQEQAQQNQQTPPAPQAAQPSPGKATAPGQQKKAAATTTNSSGSKGKATAPGQQKKATTSSTSRGTSTAPRRSDVAKANAPGQQRTNTRAVRRGNEVEPAAENANNGVPHDKVLICHATGSDTNPFVVISASVRAWEDKAGNPNGHGLHADDILLDRDSSPGDPRQKNESLCAQGVAAVAMPTGGPTPAVGPTAAVTPFAAAPFVTGAVTPSPAAAAPPAGGVAGVQATVESPGGGAGGVLGAFAALGQAAGGALPFTGFPLWAVVLIAIVAVAIGWTLWRRGRPATRDVV